MSTHRGLWSVPVVLSFLAASAFAAPAKLSTITLNVPSIAGSNPVTGTATLTANAPNGGAVVSLVSSSPSVASVPATVTVAKGLRTVNFTVTTSVVTSLTTVTISGSYNGGNASANLDVTPATLQSITANPVAFQAVTGTSTGTITLDGDAPPGGKAFALSSSDSQQLDAAEPGVSSVTVAAGQRTATFPIVSHNQAWGNPYTPVTITAAAENIWGTTVQVYPCLQPTAPAVTPLANDYIWIDDELPYGMTTSQQYTASWDTTQHASGTQSIHQQVNWITGMQPPSQLFYLEFATDRMAIGPNDSLVVYTLVHQCAPPVYMILEWRDVNTGFHYHATLGQNLGYPYLGPVPTNGQWNRYEISASDLGLPNGGIIDSFYSSSTYGMHWIDRIGKKCVEPAASPITIPGTDTIWIDDALPTGATLSGSWDTAHATSGTRSLATGGSAAAGTHSVAVSGATSTLAINTGDKLVAHVLLNSCFPATEMLIRFHTTTGETKTAWWGYVHNNEPTPNWYGGAMPAAGQWIRLEVPASNLGLEGKTIDGIQFDGVGGFAYFDAIGKTQ